MMTRLMKIAAVAAVAALTLTACGSGETFTMTSDEGIAQNQRAHHDERRHIEVQDL